VWNLVSHSKARTEIERISM